MSAPTSGFLFHYKVTRNCRVRTECTRLVETGRQQRGCLIPKAVKKHSSDPEDRQNNCPKRVALTGSITSNWLSIVFINKNRNICPISSVK